MENLKTLRKRCRHVLAITVILHVLSTVGVLAAFYLVGQPLIRSQSLNRMTAFALALALFAVLNMLIDGYGLFWIRRHMRCVQCHKPLNQLLIPSQGSCPHCNYTWDLSSDTPA